MDRNVAMVMAVSVAMGVSVIMSVIMRMHHGKVL